MVKLGGEEDGGSVFILVQVSLFVEVLVFWWCEAFLRSNEKGDRSRF